MIPKTECPYCHTLLWDDNPSFQPKKNNYCICMYCAEVSQFDKKLILVSPKTIPQDVDFKSRIAKLAIKCGVSIEQVVKDILIKEGHIKSH